MAWWDRNLKPTKKKVPPYPDANDHDWESFEKAVMKAFTLGDLAGFEKAVSVWLFEINWLRKKHEKRPVEAGEGEARMSWYRKDIEVRDKWLELYPKLQNRLRKVQDAEL